MKQSPVRSLASVNFSDVAQVGGKAASLGELSQVGIPVPPGFVVTTVAFREGTDDVLKEALLAAFDELGAQRVAVRSSAVAEDSKSASWAGQLESYLNVTRDGLIGAIEKCWDSVKSERAREYAREHGISEEQNAVAVVVQAMVNSEISGVMFTANPVTGNRDEFLIEAALGLGELLVQGEITPESLVVSRNGDVISRTASAQHEQMVWRKGKNRREPVSISDRLVDDELLRRLVNVGAKVQQQYGAPQDIEWAVEAGKLYVVQSRPITTL